MKELSIETKANLKSKNFEELTEIQSSTFHHIYQGRNILAQSKTGSGKTIAFALPFLEKKRKEGGFEEHKNPKILVMSPTRELAKQIEKQYQLLRNYESEFNICCLYGGVSVNR